MSKVATKRKRPRKWLIAWWEPVGKFVNGERPMQKCWGFATIKYKDRKAAMRGKATPRMAGGITTFIHKEGWGRKSITEIQVQGED